MENYINNNSKLVVVFEDQHVMYIYKHSGIHSINNPSGSEKTLQYALSVQFPALSDLSESGMLTRLDCETSGLILVAKNQESYAIFQKIQKEHRIQKTYLAVLDGSLKRRTVVDNFLGSRYRKSKKVINYKNKSDNKRSLPARTEFLPLKTKDNTSLVQIIISRGMRHQIRAHASHISHPLTGDTLYGSESDLKTSAEVEWSGSFFLLAWKADFFHPVTGDQISISCDVPREISSKFNL